MAEWEQVKCKYCHKDLDNVPGKVKKQFCCDAHRKASKRAESGKSEVVAGSSVDELRTTDTKQPRTLTTDKSTSDKPERTAQGNVRVSKPGDADYEPQCETTRAFIEGRDKRLESDKRGKDIKCFEDLSTDVQQAIDKMSVVKDGVIDLSIKANRTAIAINYQHLFPDRYHSTGV